jgi:hypothetical protein
LDEIDPWGPLLSSDAYAIHSNFHTTLQATPGKLVSGREMVLPIKFVADWGEIEQQRQNEIARNNKRENASRINHTYKVGDKVLLNKPVNHLRKLEAPGTGPHAVTAVYTHGILRIPKCNVNERMNIRRLFPYFEQADH